MEKFGFWPTFFVNMVAMITSFFPHEEDSGEGSAALSMLLTWFEL